jgi:predicted glycoside hydrolase/deacetylase ChbG (UPF0249 family)
MKVIFNADDFGLSRAINAGIVEAYERGLLRSASLVATGEAAEDAVEGATSHPGLDIGVHTTLIEERPALPPAQIPSLVADGRFHRQRSTLFLRYVFGRWNVAEAEAEITAQLDRVRAFGLEPSHLDGHQHLHLLPRLFPPVIALAQRHGIRFVRGRISDPLVGTGTLARKISTLAINAVSRLDWNKIPASSRVHMISFTTVGFLHVGGALTAPYLLSMLDHLRRDPEQRIVEVMLHPGHHDAETARRYGHWGYQWERDLALLLDQTLPEALARRGIEVTSFRELGAKTDETTGGRLSGTECAT